MKRLCIYHGGCFDGFTAAWIVRKFFGESVAFHAAHYGEDPPTTDRNTHVYIVDFSYPRAVLTSLAEAVLSLTVLDHHKTAKADLEDLSLPNGEIIFDMDRSGAGLTWDYFYGREVRPRLVDIVEDRDLWRFNLPETREVQAYMATLPFTFESWFALNNDLYLRPEQVILAGRAIMKYIENYGKKASEHAMLVELEIQGAKFSGPCINVPYMNSSDHANALLELFPNHPFSAYFFRRKEGGWQFGLRCREDFDVSEIAKAYGGGGHKQAAGFTVNELPPMREIR